MYGKPNVRSFWRQMVVLLWPKSLGTQQLRKILIFVFLVYIRARI